MSSCNVSDEELMRLVAAGDHGAFAELVTRHTDRFFALAFRSLDRRGDAEDVVQNSFIKLWQRPHAWDSTKSKFTTWFYRVIVNACHDHRRSRQRLVNVSNDVLEHAAGVSSSEQDQFVEKEKLDRQRHHMEQAIRQLPASQRDAINLVVYSELPQKQVAEIMGVSLKAVESLLVRAKQNLKHAVASFERTQAGGNGAVPGLASSSRKLDPDGACDDIHLSERAELPKPSII